MARLTKAYVSAFHSGSPHRSTIRKDEQRTYRADFNGALEGETVSSVTWHTDDDSIIAISGAALSSGVGSVSVTASNEGTAELSCTAALSGGRDLKQWFRIEVVDEPKA